MFSRRVKRGWTIERASTTPHYSKSEATRIMRVAAAMELSKRRVITDEQYEIAKVNGISKGTLQSRVCGSHWKVEKAINIPVMTRRQCLELSYFYKSRNFGKAVV